MNKPLLIKKTTLSPKVVFHKEKNVFFISGKSILANAFDFYNPIIEWLKVYFKNPNKSFEITFYFEYLNSSSSIQISNIVKILNENINGNSKFKVYWIYDIDDDIMEETGYEFLSNTNINHEIKQFDMSEFEEFDFE